MKKWDIKEKSKEVRKEGKQDERIWGKAGSEGKSRIRGEKKELKEQ